MPYNFSERSLSRLAGVHANLLAVAHRAILISEQDFAVVQGLRTAEEQEAAFLSGASQRRTGGKHQIGHAIDVMACVGDLDRDGDKDENWEEEYYYAIATAFRTAAIELGVAVTWGAVWDRDLAMLSENLIKEAHDYKWKRKRGKGFFDGGHFELRFAPATVVTA